MTSRFSTSLSSGGGGQAAAGDARTQSRASREPHAVAIPGTAGKKPARACEPVRGAKLLQAGVESSAIGTRSRVTTAAEPMGTPGDFGGALEEKVEEQAKATQIPKQHLSTWATRNRRATRRATKEEKEGNTAGGKSEGFRSITGREVQATLEEIFQHVHPSRVSGLSAQVKNMSDSNSQDAVKNGILYANFSDFLRKTLIRMSRVLC